MITISRLKDLRKSNQRTQLAVQMATGIDQSLLSKYERHERIPTTPDLIALADYYHTSVDYLLERTDVREPYPPASK